MTKLATTTDVRNLARLGSNIDEITTAIDAALDAASIIIEDKIRTRFDRDTRYDIFNVQHRQTLPGLYEYHWRLTNGFVDSAETFTVKIADKISDFSGVAGTDYNDITDDCIIDYTKGLVSVVAGQVNELSIPNEETRIIGNFIRVDYTSGFDVTSGAYDDVPEWLKQIAVYAAIVQLDALAPGLRHTDEDARFSLNQLKGVYNSLYTGRIRYFPKYQNPVAKS